jgi:hypothetical protein
MKILKLSILASALLLSISSCKKEEDPKPNATTNGSGIVSINLAHKFGYNNEVELTLGKDVKHPMTKDTLNFSVLKYYISNLKLKKTDGTFYTQPESYYLVDLANPASLSLSVTNVPVGDYTDLSFTMGVDSTRNVSGAQTGALSISNMMFWKWSTGYVMLKAEGTYKDNGADSSFVFHLGGFSGVNNIVTPKSLYLGSNPLTISTDKTSNVYLEVNPGWMWHSAPSVKALNTIHMPGIEAKTMPLGFIENSSFLLNRIEE